MKNAHYALLMMTLVLASTLLVASCAGPKEGTGGAPSAPVAAMERPATGTSDDSLAACMARIPEDASAGQRMFAEESCRRDEAGRKAIQAVPGQ